MKPGIDTKPVIGTSPAELQRLWIAAHPRPEWDDPNHWAAARPAEAQ